MKLYMPTKVYMEHDCVLNHADELASFGTKAFIVTGAHSSKVNGSLSDVQNALDSQGIGYFVFDQVEANPSVETVSEGATEALEQGCDFFIGVGGGSPMDAAKAMAVLAKNPQFIKCAHDALYTEANLSAFPVVAIPTTCGTGSEVTQYAVLTRHALQTKKSIASKLFPALALVDVVYLKKASYDTIKSTCVDALSHLIESYLSSNANSLNRMYAREGLLRWGKVKEALRTEVQFAQATDQTYELFMQASVIAGMAIAQTGTSLPHALSYSVTYTYGTPHGSAVGIFLPGYLETYGNQKLVNEVLSYLGFESVNAFRDYIRQVIGDVPVEVNIWKQATENLLADSSKCANHPFAVTEKEIYSYLRLNPENQTYVL